MAPMMAAKWAMANTLESAIYREAMQHGKKS
jgi:hypothetical protein